MRIARTIEALRQAVAVWRRESHRIALVPTMGNLHAGHLRLVEEAQACADVVIVSIFVNPLQFDRPDDLEAYPRTLEEDGRQLEALGVDLLFAPPEDEVYPPRGGGTRVEVPGLSEILEGRSRPGHFSGVATVVSKLFNLAQPDVAVFGEKDFQQLLVIHRLVADLNVPVEIVGVPTIREADGLAMSSRNGYLTPEERRRAPTLYRVLSGLAQGLREGERDYEQLEQAAVKMLQEAGFRPDYVTVRRSHDLATPAASDRRLVILAAAWLGKARLIDNLPLDL